MFYPGDSPGPAARPRGKIGFVICEECKERRHENCPGGSWCDCQHQPPEQAQESAESPLSWPHQG
jgi:hypothetical protein